MADKVYDAAKKLMSDPKFSKSWKKAEQEAKDISDRSTRFGALSPEEKTWHIQRGFKGETKRPPGSARFKKGGMVRSNRDYGK